ncbi:L,D-transpeptidase [Paracoccaceae bacterium Fryx2]|nr:L,D-transpeptidase [Paracoccaceae bacterium Fryx2]
MPDHPKLPPLRLSKALLLLALTGLAACAAPPDVLPASGPQVDPALQAMYAPIQDGENAIPAVPAQYLSERNKRQEVAYWTEEEPGTIVVDPHERFLYFILEDNRALRYGVAVGKAGLAFAGTGNVPFKREWPGWTPTRNMLETQPEMYGKYAAGLEGGIDNPLGARALYLFKGGKDTMYRIHGTNDASSIGQATSAGCIRLFNQDILDLYERVPPNTRVVVLDEMQAGQGTTPPPATLSAANAMTPTKGKPIR